MSNEGFCKVCEETVELIDCELEEGLVCKECCREMESCEDCKIEIQTPEKEKD